MGFVGEFNLLIDAIIMTLNVQYIYTMYSIVYTNYNDINIDSNTLQRLKQPREDAFNLRLALSSAVPSRPD